jgi:hypothetical protein
MSWEERSIAASETSGIISTVSSRTEMEQRCCRRGRTDEFGCSRVARDDSLCTLKRPHAAAPRFSGDAYTAEPKFAEDVPARGRDGAGCAAALAGCGQGVDADSLDDTGRARWRRRALDWIRQDLTWSGKALDSSDAHANAQVRQNLRRHHEGCATSVPLFRDVGTQAIQRK